MRKQWYAAWAAAAVAAGSAGVACAAPEDAAAAVSNYGPQQSTSWTSKLTAPFKKNPFTKNPFAKKSAPPVKPSKELDPISLSYKSGPETPELYQSMAELAYRGGNVDQARQLYQKALAIDPKNLSSLLSAARMEDREGHLDVALGLYDRAAKAHPKKPTALNDLALCLARKGDLASAHQVLEQAINIEPRKALYRNNVAKVLIEMNRLDAAAAHLAAVHTPAVTHYNMGVLLSERGRTAEATRALSLALTADPQMASAHTLMAQLNPAAAQNAGAAPRQPYIQTALAPQGTAIVGGQPAMQFQAPQNASPARVSPVAPASAASNSSILPTPMTPPVAATAGALSTPWPAQPPAAPQNSPIVLPAVN